VEAVAEARDQELAAARDLPPALRGLVQEVAGLSDAISRRYVSHVRPRALDEDDDRPEADRPEPGGG
jgi:hypothetical protein